MRESILSLKKKLSMYQGLEVMINRISPEVCSVIDLGSFLQAVVDELGRTMGVCRCEVLTRDAENKLKVAYEYRAHGELPVHLGYEVPMDGLFNLLDGEGSHPPMAIDDVSSVRLSESIRAVLQERGVLSAAIVPIRFKDELLALVGLYHCRRPYRWGVEEMGFLQSIAQQVAIAFQYTRLYAEKEREVEVTRTLLEIANDVNSRADSLEVTLFIVQRAAQMLGAQYGCLALMVNSGHALQLEPFVAPGGEGAPEPRQATVVLSEFPALRDSLGRRQTLFLGVGAGHGWQRNLLRDVFGGASVILVPLIVGQEVFGALCLVWVKTLSSPTPKQVALAEGLANQMAISLERGRLSAEILRLKRELRGVRANETIIGNSDAIKRSVQMALSVAEGMTTVLLQGESGTGKELFADLIHYSSPRHDRPYIKINCGAIPEPLIESELFGYEKGAFTGADSRRIGRFEEADGGTLFLDEVGELSLAAQVKLLRVLQNGEFNRIGGNQTIRTNVRLIAATNINLDEALRARKLREDLYYRLNVYPIRIPPLRERREDIPLLVSYFLELYRKRNNKYVAGLSEKAMAGLRAYPWPGNVRELENAMERAVLLATGRLITLNDLPENLRTGTGQSGEHAVSLPLGTTMAEAERRLILETLDYTGGDKAKAARILGIGRKTLYRKLGKLS